VRNWLGLHTRLTHRAGYSVDAVGIERRH